MKAPEKLSNTKWGFFVRLSLSDSGWIQTSRLPLTRTLSKIMGSFIVLKYNKCSGLYTRTQRRLNRTFWRLPESSLQGCGNKKLPVGVNYLQLSIYSILYRMISYYNMIKVRYITICIIVWSRWGNDERCIPRLCSGNAVTSSPSAPCGGTHSRRCVYCQRVSFGSQTSCCLYVTERKNCGRKLKKCCWLPVW